MQIAIDISEEMWERVKKGYVPLGIGKHLKNGTPLPKGHGRLIDADYKVSSDGRTIDTVCGYMAPTIIEADKESEKNDD